MQLNLEVPKMRKLGGKGASSTRSSKRASHSPVVEAESESSRSRSPFEGVTLLDSFRDISAFLQLFMVE